MSLKAAIKIGRCLDNQDGLDMVGLKNGTRGPALQTTACFRHEASVSVRLRSFRSMCKDCKRLIVRASKCKATGKRKKQIAVQIPRVSPKLDQVFFTHAEAGTFYTCIFVIANLLIRMQCQRSSAYILWLDTISE